MVKVGIVSDSPILSRTVGVFLISRGYYVNHVFPNQIDGTEKSFDVFVLDMDGISKVSPGRSYLILDKLTSNGKHTIVITSEKSVNKLKELMEKGIKGVVDSSLQLADVSEKVYEILQTLPIKDDDKRKHYRVRVEYGVIRIEVLPGKIVEGQVFDVSAGGVSANFRNEGEANMFINNKAYPCEMVFGNVVIRAKIFLVRRDGLFCGFKFFGMDERQLLKISEFIYSTIIEQVQGFRRV